jgi:hypothetical protein
MIRVSDFQGKSFTFQNVDNHDSLLKLVSEAFHVKDFKLKNKSGRYNFRPGENDEVLMCPGFSGGMQVIVKFPNGKTVPFDCDLDSHFVKLKRKISEKYT